MFDPRNCYRRLGLEPGAGLAEVKAAYRRLAKQTHPDLGGSASSDDFNEIHQAYQVLTTPRGLDGPIFGTLARADHHRAGRGPSGGTGPAFRLRAVRREGPDLIYVVEISGQPSRLDLPHQGQAACPDCGPKTRTDCLRCFGLGRVPRFHLLRVDLPAGAAPGKTIRLTGQGEVGPDGYGDLVVELVAPRDGLEAAP